MKIVYIAHPVSGDIKGNLEKIKKIIRTINLNRPDVLPFAHYVVDCESLDDDNPEERERGIQNDIELFRRKFIDELWLYGDKISKGMLAEIQLCHKLDIPVLATSENLKTEYNNLLKQQVIIRPLNYNKDKLKMNQAFKQWWLTDGKLLCGEKNEAQVRDIFNVGYKANLSPKGE